MKSILRKVDTITADFESWRARHADDEGALPVKGKLDAKDYLSQSTYLHKNTLMFQRGTQR